MRDGRVIDDKLLLALDLLDRYWRSDTRRPA